MTVRRPSHGKRCGTAVAVCAALSLVLVSTAQAVEPPAPGNLIANWGFDINTAGWGSFNGTLARTTNGSLCSTTNPGAATVTRRTGSVYTISDSVGGNLPTVRSTVASDVSTQAVRSGSTLALRIEQSGAQGGDAFTVDDVFLRRAKREFGPASPGTIWTRMSGDLSRISTYSVLDPRGFPDGTSRYLDRLRMYLDGRGGATGSQKLRAVIYWGASVQVTPRWLIRTSREVTIRSGTSARWVDFRFATPVYLGAIDGLTFQVGVLSGATGNVARYASSAAPAALWWSPDRHSDGPNRYFGTTDPEGIGATWSTDDKQMSIQGITAPVGLAHPESCF